MPSTPALRPIKSTAIGTIAEVPGPEVVINCDLLPPTHSGISAVSLTLAQTLSDGDAFLAGRCDEASNQQLWRPEPAA